ncbi:hypothetical protein BKA66DRAFT_566886 [Pyrenochaeta sp. MPI-SDFR-AT-0127]|nr:hypothetical protein BKA66DRAFT_566886 [Pyrenochaeta sp. MPI-SDFR-AT-0127]
MSTSAANKTGYAFLDFPLVLGHWYSHDNPTTAPLMVIFLFSLPSLRREEIVKQIEGDIDTPWPEGIPKKALAVVPWLRSSKFSAYDDLYIPIGLDIVIDEKLLEERKCIIAHRLDLRNAPINNDVREFAIVRIEEAHKLVCSASATKSWFPDTLPWECEYQPLREPEPKPSTLRYDKAELPVFIVVPMTKEQETYLFTLLSCEMAQPEFFHLHNTGPDLDDMDHLMNHFLENASFPSDFVIVDKETVATIPNPIPTSSEQIPYVEFGPPYPTFTLASELLFWHLAGDEQSIACDNVGYGVGPRTLENDDEYQMWAVNVFQGKGVGNWFDSSSESEDEMERYYWHVWIRKNGRVDGQVRAEATMKF